MSFVGGRSFCRKVHQGLTTFFVKFNQLTSIKLLRFCYRNLFVATFYSLVLFCANDDSLAMEGCSPLCCKYQEFTFAMPRQQPPEDLGNSRQKLFSLQYE